MKFYELNIKTTLKVPIHFQKSPEAVSKLIASGLINGGYTLHKENFPKNYVFSNLGRANEKGFFEKEGKIIFRTFQKDLVEKLAKNLFFYEDNIFKIEGIKFKEVKYKPVKEMTSLNPIFIRMKNGDFWTFQKSGNLGVLLSALQDNLIRKYEMIYNEKLNPQNNFIEYFQIKNNKPQTLFFKGIKFFGWKLFIIPRNDEISQKLAFISLGSGLGHKNSTVGGGFLNYKFE
jgi:CRISPR-associated endoribonuclease Cas6